MTRLLPLTRSGLGIPAAWNQFFERRPDGQASIALTAGLGQSRALYDETLRTLKDPQSTRLILTATLSRGQIRETARLAEEYSDAGLRNLSLVLNAEMEKASGEEGTLDAAVFRRQRQVLRSLPKALSALPRTVLPLQSRRAAGVDALQGIFRWGTRPPEPKPTAWYPSTKTLATLVRELHDAGPGLILLVGKRSVGKTTLAAAIALRLAALGGDVHLVTTDPAALKASGIRDTVPGLEVTAVDPRKETGRYRVLMLRTAGRTMKEDEKALLEEDLRGPWAEETAVFYAVSRYFREAETRFLVMDTAPEGHTLLLIDAADTYHRAAANRLGIERTFRTPLEFLQEPALTRAIFVTRAEPSALRETKFLKDDLRRAGIAPWAYIVNGSLAAAGPMSPILKTWAAAEEPLFTRVAANTRRYAVVPLESEKPIGAEQLLKLTEAEEPDKPEG
ncbi:arsenical pump-driving ATPase [Sutterella sp. AF15-45LB]|nr:arsenical pump-driving ATPase [Sutterella sp. AF15-45LB]RGU80368.1 arsenical pump-driving ATPase [Sutterella sp. AF15-44LB]